MNTVFLTHPQDMLQRYFGDKALAALRTIAEVKFNPEHRELTTDELVAAARGSDVIIAYRQTPGPQALFSALPELAAFVRCAVDIRTIDIDAASAHGILVTQASAGFISAVSEWVIATMLDLGRGISAYAESYHRGEPPALVMGRELRGATLGVIGYGQISRYLCDLALAFGMRVLVADPYAAVTHDRLRQVDLPLLLSESDFVVCLAPSTAETENLIDARACASMKAGAYFINASRGELVDEAALLDALQSGHLAGCAIDVGRAPDQMPSPIVAQHPRVIATPHMGGLTPNAIEHQAFETVAQVEALFQGRMPAGAVNAAYATRLGRWGYDVAQASPVASLAGSRASPLHGR